MTALAHDPIVMLLVRASLALLFASAAWHKLRAPAEFRAVLAAYRVVPDPLVPTLGATIGALEAGVAFAWLGLGGTGLASGATIALLALYSGAIAVNLARGRRAIDCGCGVGGASQPIGEWLLVRNALLAVAAVVGARPIADARTLVWVDAVTFAGGLALVACAWVAAHGLAAARGVADARGLAAATARVREVGAAR